MLNLKLLLHSVLAGRRSSKLRLCLTTCLGQLLRKLLLLGLDTKSHLLQLLLQMSDLQQAAACLTALDWRGLQ